MATETKPLESGSVSFTFISFVVVVIAVTVAAWLFRGLVLEPTQPATVISSHYEKSFYFPGSYDSGTFIITVQLEDGTFKDLKVSQGVYLTLSKNDKVVINNTTVTGKQK